MIKTWLKSSEADYPEPALSRNQYGADAKLFN